MLPAALARATVQEFWNRWNITVSRVLKFAFYDPITEGELRLGGAEGLWIPEAGRRKGGVANVSMPLLLHGGTGLARQRWLP